MKNPLSTPQFKSGESGQAIIEYVLILIVVLSLLLGLLYQFNTAFRGYTTALFSEYTACLLETGELPGDSAGECAAELNGAFNARQFGAGNSNGNGGSGNSGSGAGGDEDGGQSKSLGRRSANTDRGRLDRDSGAVAGRSEGSGGTVGFMKAPDFFNKKGRPSKQTVGEVSDGKSYTGSTTSGKRPRLVGNLPAPVDEKRTTLDRRFVAEADEEKEKEPPKQNAAVADENATLQKKKVSYDVKRKTASTEAEEEGFSIGALLRFLLIAAIIIALGMLLLGQGVQISKSWEK